MQGSHLVVTYIAYKLIVINAVLKSCAWIASTWPKSTGKAVH